MVSRGRQRLSKRCDFKNEPATEGKVADKLNYHRPD